MIGNRVHTLDAWDKVSGTSVYGIDLKLPGMLHGKIVRSPHPHAKITHIETSKAKRLLGVRAVVTAEDTPREKYGTQIDDEYPLAVEKVRYVGDEVAAVAAVDEDTALEAIDLIRVEYEELPAVFSPHEAILPGAPKVHDVDRNIASHIEFERGDLGEGLAMADHIIEEEYTTSNVHPGYLEPHVCVASPEPGGRLAIWASLQAPGRNRQLIAKILRIPESKLGVIQTVVGGGFGGKASQVIPLYPIAAFLALKASKPVRVVNTWEEEFAVSRSRVPVHIKIRLGIKNDGTFTGKKLKILASCGAYAGTGPAVFSTTATRASALYRFGNLKCRADLVYSNITPFGSVRGYGNPQLHYALESTIDMAAEVIGMDPLDVRIKNAAETGDVTDNGFILSSCLLKECLETAAKKMGWKKKRSKRRAESLGIGMASMIHVSGNRAVYPFFDGATAYVRINSDLGIDLITGEADIGQGSNTIFAQIVAEVLGVSAGEIRPVPLDTDHSPFGLGTFASRVTTIGGKAVQMAAEDAKRQLLEISAEHMEANVNDLECSGGKIYVKGSSESGMEIGEVGKLAFNSSGGASITGVGKYVVPPTVVIPDKTKYGNISSAYSFGVQVAEVQVNPDTGKVNILRVMSVHDSGRIINPMLAEGQIEGGVSQGIGYSLLEEIVRQDGKVLNNDFTDYRMPTIYDVPKISSQFVEIPDPHGPFGAKGLGEITLVPTAAAIANAIYDAVGIRLKEVPFTPEKVLKALRTKREANKAS
jgi:CO/xanthine dehydrogenase Mo-binding subunit